MQYKAIAGSDNILLTRDDGSQAVIPNDPRNADRMDFASWCALGNAPIAADPPPPPDPAVAKLAADVAAAAAYAKLTALKAMSPAQIQAWTAVNVTNFAQAQDAITTLAIAVSVLARKIQ
jgi:hypothetical protein